MKPMPIKELGSDKVMKDVYERCFLIAKDERDEARTIARKLYAEVKRLEAYIEFDRRYRIPGGWSR